MPKLTIENPSQLTANEAYTRLKELLARDSELKTFDRDYSCLFDEDQKRGTAQGKQFRAAFEVFQHGTGSLIRIDVDYPFFLTPLRNKLKETLEKKLVKALA